MRTIYKAGFQLAKVRFVQAITLLMSGGIVYLGSWGFRGPGANTAPDHLLGAVFITLGLVFTAGIWVYCQSYIARVEISDDARRLRFTFPGFVLPTRLEVGTDEVESAGSHAGYMRSGGITVNAPWDAIRLRGRWLGAILDWQGDFVEEDLVSQYLLGRPPVEKKQPRRTSVEPER